MTSFIGERESSEHHAVRPYVQTQTHKVLSPFLTSSFHRTLTHYTMTSPPTTTMHFTKQIALAILAAASTLASAATVPANMRRDCSAEQRLATAQLLPDSYNHHKGASFDRVPFAPGCVTMV